MVEGLLQNTHFNILSFVAIMKVTKGWLVLFLVSEGNNKDNTITQLEKDLAKAEQTVKDTIVRMNKEMDDMKNAHEFQLNSMKLQLEAATVKLREINDFALRKKAIEEENTAYVSCSYNPAKRTTFLLNQ